MNENNNRTYKQSQDQGNKRGFALPLTSSKPPMPPVQPPKTPPVQSPKKK